MRFSAMHFATELGVNGFVQYNSRGEIVIEAEGDEEHLKEFVRWCREGSATMVVSGVEVIECETKWYTSFDIRRGLYGGGTLSENPGRIKLMKLFFKRLRRVFGDRKQEEQAENFQSVNKI